MIRLGTVSELKLMWGNSNSPTQQYFIQGIEKGRQEFWVVEEDISKRLIGELHIIWDSEDKDEANGVSRAYLCAFRINKDYQGLGLGSALMRMVLQRVTDKGFTEATIGVEEDAPKLIKMYNDWGFVTHIKSKTVDHHDVDSAWKPKHVEPYMLLLRSI